MTKSRVTHNILSRVCLFLMLFLVLNVSSQTFSSSERMRVITTQTAEDGGHETLIPGDLGYEKYANLSRLKSGLKTTDAPVELGGCWFEISWFGGPSEAEKDAVKAGLANAVSGRSFSNSGNPVKASIAADYGLSSNTLASASADWILNSSSGSSVWYSAILIENTNGGGNSNGSDYDISISFNATLSWNLTTSGGANYNLMYVIMHEMTHGMGVLSSATYNTLGWSALPTIFDLGLRDGSGNVVWGNANYSSEEELHALFTSGNVWFEDIVELYAPGTYSSQAISHFDVSYSGVDQLMTPFYNLNTIYTSVGSKVNQVHSANGWGATSTTTPVADFSANTTNGTAPLSVDLTDASANTPTSWLWDFGDGTATSTDQNPSHTYTTPGVYTVILTATNSAGSDTETKTDYIEVYDEFTVDAGPDQSISAGMSTTLEGSYTGGSGEVDITWTPGSLIMTQGVLDPQTVELQKDTVFYLSITDLKTEIIKMDSIQIGIIVGIESFEKNGILIYPNPTNGKVNIEFNNKQVRLMRITDVSGRLILMKTLVNQRETIDLSSLESGVYIISIQEGDKTHTERIIKE